MYKRIAICAIIPIGVILTDLHFNKKPRSYKLFEKYKLNELLINNYMDRKIFTRNDWREMVNQDKNAKSSSLYGVIKFIFYQQVSTIGFYGLIFTHILHPIIFWLFFLMFVVPFIIMSYYIYNSYHEYYNTNNDHNKHDDYNSVD